MENKFEVDIEKTFLEFQIKYNMIVDSQRNSDFRDTKNIHVKTLTHFNDENFIFNLYKILFKRNPDAEGFKNYYAQLKNGTDKITIIRELQSSSEGKKNNVIIHGLFFPTLNSKLNKFFIYKFIKNFINLFQLLWKSFYFYKHHSVLFTLQNQLENAENQISSMRFNIEKLHEQLEKHNTSIVNISKEAGITLKEEIKDWDEFYADFENTMRGPQELIKKRQEVYIPLLQDIRIPEKTFTILDLGSGRGEWLELLAKNNFNGLGIDNNIAAIDACLKRNLPVINEDVMTYLSQQPNESIGAITAFHIIEHLPFVTLLKLIDEAYRVLKTEGLILLETPNPNNVLVGSCHFYLDPTHKKPLPYNLMEFILVRKGFKNVKVIELNSLEMYTINVNDELTHRFNHLFYGPADYAVIGYK